MIKKLRTDNNRSIEIDDISGRWRSKEDLQKLRDIDVPVNVFVTPSWFDDRRNNYHTMGAEMKILFERPEIFNICWHGWDHYKPPEGYRSQKQQLEMVKKLDMIQEKPFTQLIMKMPGNRWNFNTVWALTKYDWEFLVVNQPVYVNDTSLLFDTLIYDLRKSTKDTSPIIEIKSIQFHYGRDVDVNRINEVKDPIIIKVTK